MSAISGLNNRTHLDVSKQPNNLNNLSSELVQMIMGYLPSEDYGALMLTSKKFHAIALTDYTGTLPQYFHAPFDHSTSHLSPLQKFILVNQMESRLRTQEELPITHRIDVTTNNQVAASKEAYFVQTHILDKWIIFVPRDSSQILLYDREQKACKSIRVATETGVCAAPLEANLDASGSATPLLATSTFNQGINI